MKRKYTIEVTATVFMDPANAKGRAARRELGVHTQRMSYIGEDGGKFGNCCGDADHLTSCSDGAIQMARQVVSAAIYKGHYTLMEKYPDVRVDMGQDPEDAPDVAEEGADGATAAQAGEDVPGGELAGDETPEADGS